MPRRPVVRLVFAAIVLLGACGGSDKPAVPEGEPIDVVRAAADRTQQAGTAQVFVDGPDGRHSEGTVDLGTGKGTMTLKDATTPSPVTVQAATPASVATVPEHFKRIEYTDPKAVADLLRHVETVDPFGGLSVRGAGVIRYDITIRPPGQEPFFADAYIDADGRLRRLTVAEDRRDHRVTDREYRLARLITVDYVFK